MTKQEMEEFDKLLLSIARHKNRKLVEINESEYISMIPMMDVLAKFRGFTNYIKSKKKAKK